MARNSKIFLAQVMPKTTFLSGSIPQTFLNPNLPDVIVVFRHRKGNRIHRTYETRSGLRHRRILRIQGRHV
jgi:hypothetical protein